MLNRLLSFLFPDRCFICDKVMLHQKDGFHLCADCTEKLKPLQVVHACPLCGRPDPQDDDYCEICLSHGRKFDRALTCFSYEEPLRRSILHYKFYGHRDYVHPFALLLYRRLLPMLKEQSFDIIVYPPMTKKSYNERGYNQSELLAKALAKHLDTPCCKNAFIKIKETPKQSTLNYIDRKKNVDKAFALNLSRETFHKKHILLVDDVFTTGATAEALAKLLKTAGTKSVTVLTLASPMQREDYVFDPQDEIDVTF